MVSFIAPHSLTARALVVAPHDPLTIDNASARTGRRARRRPAVCELPPGGDPHWRSLRATPGTLAQLPGATFYHRLREKFGRLAR